MGILFVNTEVQPVQTIYIKAHVSRVQSVLMAEVAALALAAMVNDNLNFNNTMFLLDCRQLVDFLNQTDQEHKFLLLLLRSFMRTCCRSGSKDGNGANSDRMKSLYTRTRNPKSKPETTPNTDSGDNPSQNQTRGYPKPEWIRETRFLRQHNNNNKGFL